MDNVVRGYLTQGLPDDVFIYQVASCIEGQLKKMDFENGLTLVQFPTSYELIIEDKGIVYECDLCSSMVNELKNQEIYALDRFIWNVFIQKGLKVNKEKLYCYPTIGENKHL
jgi:hypothetical protein